jgi:hypothetical protein
VLDGCDERDIASSSEGNEEDADGTSCQVRDISPKLSERSTIEVDSERRICEYAV